MSKTSLFRGIRAVGRRARLGRSNVCNITRNRLLLPTQAGASDVQQRFKSNGNGDKDLSSIIQPIPVKPCNDPDGINVGAELTGSLKKGKPSFPLPDQSGRDWPDLGLVCPSPTFHNI